MSCGAQGCASARACSASAFAAAASSSDALLLRRRRSPGACAPLALPADPGPADPAGCVAARQAPLGDAERPTRLEPILGLISRVWTAAQRAAPETGATALVGGAFTGAAARGAGLDAQLVAPALAAAAGPPRGAPAAGGPRLGNASAEAPSKRAAARLLGTYWMCGPPSEAR